MVLSPTWPCKAHWPYRPAPCRRPRGPFDKSPVTHIRHQHRVSAFATYHTMTCHHHTTGYMTRTNCYNQPCCNPRAAGGKSAPAPPHSKSASAPQRDSSHGHGAAPRTPQMHTRQQYQVCPRLLPKDARALSAEELASVNALIALSKLRRS
ncbi:uncharacterized protein SCHCODRAFT_01270431 [Schizophyllum commune H4-8]|uniref:uncharacterized protein n=1 Tax=Schizophyllum commune (strain H4-8 / FGSC 9210) TaxID=578458 RepID=UPI00215EB76A|nr:uncharacterized protein SCHCODRAFT_01270431 [Schizophyllum commune H4-8]KAI5899872.1 hypothetical protein SCHCODRAFT_01270431 [Schizophyllum commune H4-8]